MALVDLKSNLANFRSDFKTPSVESQTVKKLNQPTAVKDTFRPTDSKMDIDTIPRSYIRKTQFTKAFVDRSSFDRADDYILKYTGRTRFTLKTINTSKFNIDSSLTKFSVNGKSKLSDKKFVNAYSRFNIDSTPNKFSSVGKSKLSDVRIVNKSLFNIDSVLSKFSTTGIYAPSRFDKIANVNNSKFNIDSTLDKFTANGKKPSKYNSSKPIDALYKKFNEQHNLRDDAFNYSYIKHPLILRGIQRKGKERPNRWGVDALVNLDSGLVRGGITAALDRAVNDTARIAKWMASPKGIMWVIKQVGLGLSNPKVEATGGILTRQTRIHTGVASLLSVPGTAFGLHFTRHGIPFANETASYENVSKLKNNTLTYDKPLGVGNRLWELRKALNVWGNERTGLLNFKGSRIELLSGLGGAQSVYGIGYTSIRRAVDTRKEALDLATKEYKFYRYRTSYFGSLKANTNISFDTRDISTFTVEDFENGKSYYNGRGQKWEYDSLKANITLDDMGNPLSTDAIKKLIYNPSSNPNLDPDAKRLIANHNPSKITHYVSSLKAKTGKLFDTLDSNEKLRTVEDVDNTGLKDILDTAHNSQSDGSPFALPNQDTETTPNPIYKRLKTNGTDHPISDYRGGNIKSYASMTYPDIRQFAIDRSENPSSIKDFREGIKEQGGAKVPEFVGRQEADYYKNRNLEGYYGFSKAGHHPDVKARGEDSFFDIATNKSKFTGDKVNAIDIIKAPTDPGKIYPDDANDFIKFYFADGDMPGETQLKNIMVFRSTITGLSETFSPGWDSIQIMGRPDSVYRYSSFERSISFSFKVAAMSRAEMIPLWRKLNFLASYTMPDWSSGLAGGPFMRLTLGDLYQNCPGFIESLSYTYPDDGVWDINDDKLDLGKQLPTIVEVNVGYKIIGKYRPQNMGRVFALSKNDTNSKDDKTQWLTEDIQYPEVKEKPEDPDPSTTSPSF